MIAGIRSWLLVLLIAEWLRAEGCLTHGLTGPKVAARLAEKADGVRGTSVGWRHFGVRVEAMVRQTGVWWCDPNSRRYAAMTLGWSWLDDSLLKAVPDAAWWVWRLGIEQLWTLEGARTKWLDEVASVLSGESKG
jgi:hypothetical protein